jgi:hypothetical protein
MWSITKTINTCDKFNNRSEANVVFLKFNKKGYIEKLPLTWPETALSAFFSDLAFFSDFFTASAVTIKVCLLIKENECKDLACVVRRKCWVTFLI